MENQDMKMFRILCFLNAIYKIHEIYIIISLIYISYYPCCVYFHVRGVLFIYYILSSHHPASQVESGKGTGLQVGRVIG